MEPALHAGTELVLQKSIAKCLKINTPSRKLFDRSPEDNPGTPRSCNASAALLPRYLRFKRGSSNHYWVPIGDHGSGHAPSASSFQSLFKKPSSVRLCNHNSQLFPRHLRSDDVSNNYCNATFSDHALVAPFARWHRARSEMPRSVSGGPYAPRGVFGRDSSRFSLPLVLATDICWCLLWVSERRARGSTLGV